MLYRSVTHQFADGLLLRRVYFLNVRRSTNLNACGTANLPEYIVGICGTAQ